MFSSEIFFSCEKHKSNKQGGTLNTDQICPINLGCKFVNIICKTVYVITQDKNSVELLLKHYILP